MGRQCSGPYSSSHREGQARDMPCPGTLGGDQLGSPGQPGTCQHMPRLGHWPPPANSWGQCPPSAFLMTLEACSGLSSLEAHATESSCPQLPPAGHLRGLQPGLLVSSSSVFGKVGIGERSIIPIFLPVGDQQTSGQGWGREGHCPLPQPQHPKLWRSRVRPGMPGTSGPGHFPDLQTAARDPGRSLGRRHGLSGSVAGPGHLSPSCRSPGQHPLSLKAQAAFTQGTSHGTRPCPRSRQVTWEGPCHPQGGSSGKGWVPEISHQGRAQEGARALGTGLLTAWEGQRRGSPCSPARAQAPAALGPHSPAVRMERRQPKCSSRACVPLTGSPGSGTHPRPSLT